MRFGFGQSLGSRGARIGYSAGRGLYGVVRAGGAWVATTPAARRRRGGSHRPVAAEPVQPSPRVIHVDRYIVLAVLCAGLWLVHGWL